MTVAVGMDNFCQFAVLFDLGSCSFLKMFLFYLMWTLAVLKSISYVRLKVVQTSMTNEKLGFHIPR